MKSAGSGSQQVGITEVYPVNGEAGKRGYAVFAAEGMLSLFKYKIMQKENGCQSRINTEY